MQHEFNLHVGNKNIKLTSDKNIRMKTLSVTQTSEG